MCITKTPSHVSHVTHGQACRVEANCTGPLTLDIDTDMSELHLEPVAVSPYALPGTGDQGAAADTSPKGREVIGGERNNRKDSVRAWAY